MEHYWCVNVAEKLEEELTQQTCILLRKSDSNCKDLKRSTLMLVLENDDVMIKNHSMRKFYWKYSGNVLNGDVLHIFLISQLIDYLKSPVNF